MFLDVRRSPRYHCYKESPASLSGSTVFDDPTIRDQKRKRCSMRTRLTSLDINRQTFTIRGKGYDREEVAGFLRQVSEEFERSAQELTSLERRVNDLANENSEHRQREVILKETLLTAQKTAEDVRNTARREAELIVREAEMLADRLSDQARVRAGEIEKTIGDLRFERRKFHSKLQNMIDLFQQTIDFDRQKDASEGSVVTLKRRAGEDNEASGV